MSVVKGLKKCPKCDYDAIFVPLVTAVGYDGRLYGSRSEGFCNNPQCDQLLWYYPHSGRVTRRKVGHTLKEYQARKTDAVNDVHIINSLRRSRGLSQLVEVDGFILRPRCEPHACCRGPGSWITRWFTRSYSVVESWFWWIVAAIKSPFLGKPPSSLVDKLMSGDKSINDIRAEQGFDSVEVDNAE